MPTGRQTVERRQLGLTLRRLRREAGLSQQEAARAINRHYTRISHLESAKASLSIDELGLLLDRYGVSDADRETVLALGAVARKRQRGKGYTDQLPKSFERLADLQADAAAIGFYDTGIVPGLAQSQDYIVALMRAADGIWWEASEDEIERRVAFRLQQQRRVLEAEEPKQIDFVLTESALEEVVGSPEIMRGQLLHLLQLGERPSVSIRVLSRATTSKFLLGGGLVTLDFAGNAPRIACAGSHGPCTYHDQEVETASMFRAWETVRELALDPESARALLIEKLKDLK
ncbi:helix-turn-helix transcriptional regulator [Saccharopolyspora sp. 6V]|uniref:helix-turn-helix domain-containing protein n=1 Tax=Saccharopolyspora sp. 6V TaxID=2877239 RepID=UPI001CD28E2B|nr:helix-turn-helix transcriptional regulator [Saccharopolyspora sp. 6V]MCA1194711.1 helix-turn-helix transcriptional regulator [Saccharopolyspora sp. 6V]